MEQIIIYSRTGQVKYDLPNTDPILSPTSAKQQRQHMSNDYVQMSVQTSATMTLDVGDYIEVRGCRYFIRSAHNIDRTGEDEYTYTITFYGAMYLLMGYMYRDAALNGRSSQNTFDLTLSLKDSIKLIINNVVRSEFQFSERKSYTSGSYCLVYDNGNTKAYQFTSAHHGAWTGNDATEVNYSAVQSQSPWVFDEVNCPDTDPITMSFDRQNCLTAMQNILQQHGYEFRITQGLNESVGIWQYTIHVGEFGSVINNTPFSYGEGNGLYQLREGKVDDSGIINRLWAEGSTENILSGYRGYSMRLQLPRKNVPLVGSSDSRRYSRNEHTIEIDGDKIVFAAGYPIGIDDDSSRFVDEETLYAGSNDPSHGKWKKEGESAWRYAPFNPEGLIIKYGILETSEVFDNVKPSPTFRVLKVWPSDGASTPNSRLSFVCDVPFDLAEVWTDTWANFREWCLLKTQVVPTEAQYEASKTLYADNSWQSDDQGTILSFADYRREIGEGTTIDPFVLWRQRHHSAAAPPLPILPAAYNQDVYEQYELFKEYVLSGANNKYLIDGGSVAFIDGKLAGIDFPIANFIYQTKLTASQRSTLLFSTSKSYEVGDVCIRNVSSTIKAYQFTTAHQGIWNSSHATEIHIGLLTINEHQEQDTEQVFPSEDEFGAFRFRPGDKFKLVSIFMPYSYYEDAEEELWFVAYERFEKLKFILRQYKLTFDHVFVEENKSLFESILPGDYILISDDRFGLTSKKMRVTQIDCDLLTGRDYTITLENVRKKRTRTGFYLSREREEIWQAMREVGLDEPRYRRNNRTSGSSAISFLSANGYLRDSRVADAFVATRMLADNAVIAAKILDGAIGTAKIAANAVTSAKIAAKAISLGLIDDIVVAKINRASIIRRYANNGATFDRHYSGDLTFTDNKLTLKNITITDSLSRDILGYDVNVWHNASEVTLDFGDYEPDKTYVVFAKIVGDGNMTYEVVEKSGEDAAGDELLKVGEVSTAVESVRTFTPSIGQTYMSAGVLRDSADRAILDIAGGLLKDYNGTTLINLVNGYINGATKILRNNATTYSLAEEIASARTMRTIFTGSENGAFVPFKKIVGGQQVAATLQEILGELPDTAGGLRKLVSEKANAADVWQKTQCYINPETGAIIIGSNSATPTTIENTVSLSAFNTYKQQLAHTFKQIEKTFGCNNIVISNRNTLDQQVCTVDSDGLDYPEKQSQLQIDTSTRFADLQALAGKS